MKRKVISSIDLPTQIREAVTGMKQIADEVKRLAEPVDINALERDGFIERKGAWFKILNIDGLPYAFKGLMTELKTENGETFVKISKKSQFEKLSKTYEKRGY